MADGTSKKRKWNIGLVVGGLMTLAAFGFWIFGSFGLIQTFDALSHLDDPDVMAGGLSNALIGTVLGWALFLIGGPLFLVSLIARFRLDGKTRPVPRQPDASRLPD